jgi:hypothetical protein
VQGGIRRRRIRSGRVCMVVAKHVRAIVAAAAVLMSHGALPALHTAGLVGHARTSPQGIAVNIVIGRNDGIARKTRLGKLTIPQQRAMHE